MEVVVVVDLPFVEGPPAEAASVPLPLLLWPLSSFPATQLNGLGTSSSSGITESGSAPKRQPFLSYDNVGLPHQMVPPKPSATTTTTPYDPPCPRNVLLEPTHKSFRREKREVVNGLIIQELTLPICRVNEWTPCATHINTGILEAFQQLLKGRKPAHTAYRIRQ